jgi:hypothetical protein
MEHLEATWSGVRLSQYPPMMKVMACSEMPPVTFDCLQESEKCLVVYKEFQTLLLSGLAHEDNVQTIEPTDGW